MKTQKLLNVDVKNSSKGTILEKVSKFTRHPSGHFHIASLNPEIIILSQKDKAFRDYLNWAQTRIIDGIGVYVACKMRGYDVSGRVTGVDLMENLLKLAGDAGLRVALIGGKPKIAKKMADCQQKLYPTSKYVGIQGIQDISSPTKEEEDHIFSIVADLKPHLIFVAFGSPYQELWLAKHKGRLKGIICMGVGGSFDFLSGNVRRAPSVVRSLGLEWLFRLINEPWRIKRQLRIPVFAYLVLKESLFDR